MPRQQQISIGAFISMLVGLTVLGTYLFTGYTIISNKVMLLIAATFCIVAFVLALLSKQQRLGRLTLYIVITVTALYLLFFGALTFVWNEP